MKLVIVGGGVAGITAAKTLRDKDPDFPVTVFNDEPHPYYPRPQLIEFIADKVKFEDLPFYPPSWYLEKKIEVSLKSPVKQILPGEKKVVLENGEKIPYDRLLLATGSSPCPLPLKGINKPGLFMLRNLEDALAIKEYARKAEKAVVIGGGLLGLETGRALAALGLAVTILEHSDRLLPRGLDPEGSQIFQGQIEKMGLKIALNAEAEGLEGKDAITGVKLKSGEAIDGQMVLIAAGVICRADLPKSAGIKTNRGVVVNRYLETSAEYIFAAGDVAEFEGRVYGIIPAAQEQARAAAINMLEKETQTYNGTVPTTTLKVAGIDLTCIGLINPVENIYEEIKYRDLEKGVYKKIVLRDNKVVGAVILGTRKNAGTISRIIADGASVAKYRDSILKEDFLLPK